MLKFLLRSTRVVRLPLIVVAMLACGTPALAQTASSDWPLKPVKLIVPQGPGGGVDAVARVLAKGLSIELGQPVIVENKPGAGGSIGLDFVSKAPPDGYTLLVGINSQFTSTPHISPRPNFNPLVDLVPITQTTIGSGYVLAVTNGLPVSTVAELIEYAKKNPGKLSFGSYGVGSGHHLGAELLMHRSGIQMVHVPYKQTPAMNLISGHIEVLFDSQTSLRELIQNKSVRPLAVTSAQRLPALPNVPTLSETLPGISFIGWHGVWAPKGTPPQLVQKINAGFSRMLATPEVQKTMTDLAYKITSTGPVELTSILAQESRMWGTVIKEAGIKAEN